MHDIWFYRGVVLVLGVVAIGSLVGLIVGVPGRDAFIAIGSGSVGALAGIFSSPSSVEVTVPLGV